MAHQLRTAGAQRLDVFQLHPQRLLVKKEERIKSLILGAGGHIVFGQSGEKMFQLLFTRPMSRQFDNAVAITLEPGAVAALRGQRKMLSPHDIGDSLQSFFCVHRQILIHEPLFVDQ